MAKKSTNKNKFKIKIDGQIVTADQGDTILKAAKSHGIFIPNLCYHPDFCAKGNCRACLVEINPLKSSGKGKLATACSTLIEDGMEIETNTAQVKKYRNINLEMIFAEHVEKCAICIWRFECPLLKYAQKFKIRLNYFKDRKGGRKTYKFANAVELDASQCIDCQNCINACSQIQDIHYLKITGKGPEQEVMPVTDKKRQCILCGQCAVHCPVSAAQEQADWQKVEKILSEPQKILVAQFAPSIRVSIGEDFNLPYGKIMTGQIVSALKLLGFNYVFDVNFAADITTIIEAQELLERLKSKRNLPLITSCCPGWINYAEIYEPKLIPNITTARSPQIHEGGIIKTYWAEKMGIDPRKIVVVSVMPCTAKKYEATRPELKINGLYPVDFVLTTREFVFMMKKAQINPAKLKSAKTDNPLGQYSGAGTIFGASGGVMESALRTADYMICQSKKSKLCRHRIDFKSARGMEGIKEAKVNVGGVDLKIAIASGMKNVKKLIENIASYDYIELMACPGGCVGGGGQPIPTTAEIRKMRAEALYKDDKNAKIRISAENKQAVEILDWLAKNKKLSQKVLYTKFKRKKKC